MKAVVYEKKNAPEVLAICEVEKPEAREGEVLVKIQAVSVNAADYRSMRMGIIPKRKIFGADIAGRVEETGKNVTRLKVGDEVVGDISGCGFGGFAEYVAVPENALSLKPSTLSFEEAAALPLASVTALQALRDQGSIQPGQAVLIYGAGGGVGTYAVQLAKYFGAKVTAVCGAKNVELVRALGADAVIDYTKEDVTQTSRQYDLVLALNGNHSLLAYKRILTPMGICVMVGGALSQVIQFILLGSMLSMGGKKMRYLAAKPNVMDLDLILRLAEEGKVKPIIDRRYPLAETAQAMQYLGQGHARGKVVIHVA